MTHRYGRHGPHAWKRWWQRRAEQRKLPSPALAPAPTSPVVIHIHVTLAHAEKIIVVSVEEDSLLTHALKGTIVYALPADLTPDLYSSIRFQATEDAERKAREDLRQLDDALDKKELQSYAQQYWDKRNYYTQDNEIRKEGMLLRERNIAPGDVYVKIFSDVYSQKVAEEGKNVLDANTKAILRQARVDKTWDALHGEALSEHWVIVQAAIRVYELLHLNPREQREKLHEYIELYRSRYEGDYYSVQGGGDGSSTGQNGFLNETWQYDQEPTNGSE